MNPPSEVTVLSVIEPRELSPLSLLLLEAALDMLTFAKVASKLARLL